MRGQSGCAHRQRRIGGGQWQRPDGSWNQAGIHGGKRLGVGEQMQPFTEVRGQTSQNRRNRLRSEIIAIHLGGQAAQRAREIEYGPTDHPK